MATKSVGDILHQLDSHDIPMVNQMTAGHSIRPVQAVRVEQRGACDVRDDTVLTFTHPAETQIDICPGLLRALRPFIVAEALGIVSAEADGYLVSCPGKKGTTWRVQAARRHEQ